MQITEISPDPEYVDAGHTVAMDESTASSEPLTSNLDVQGSDRDDGYGPDLLERTEPERIWREMTPRTG
jgi:hypothetical protein